MREESVDVTGQTEAAQAGQSREKPDGMIDPAGEAGWYLQRERESRGETPGRCQRRDRHPSLSYRSHRTWRHDPHAGAHRGARNDRHLCPVSGFRSRAAGRALCPFLCRARNGGTQTHPPTPHPFPAPRSSSSAAWRKFPKACSAFQPEWRSRAAWSPRSSSAALLFAGASWMMLPRRSVHPTGRAGQRSDADRLHRPRSGSRQDHRGADCRRSGAPSRPHRRRTGRHQSRRSRGADRGKCRAGSSTRRTRIGRISRGHESTTDGRAYGAKASGGRLVLKAKAPVWVRIEDAQGNVVMTHMLMGGDTYRCRPQGTRGDQQDRTEPRHRT